MQGVNFCVILSILVSLEHVERSTVMSMNPSGSLPSDHQDNRFVDVPDEVSWNMGKDKYLRHCERDVRELKPLVNKVNEQYNAMTHEPAKNLYGKFREELMNKEMKATYNFREGLYGKAAADLKRFNLNELEEKYKKKFEKKNWHWPSLRDDGGRSSGGASSSHASSSNIASSSGRASRTPQADEDYVLGEEERFLEDTQRDIDAIENEEEHLKFLISDLINDKGFPQAVVRVLRFHRHRLKEIREKLFETQIQVSTFDKPARFLRGNDFNEENDRLAKELGVQGVTLKDYQKLLGGYDWKKLPSFKIHAKKGKKLNDDE